MKNYWEAVYSSKTNINPGNIIPIDPIYIKNIKQLNIDLESKDILEIGVGGGRFTQICYLSNVAKYTGLDIDDYFFPDLKAQYNQFEFQKIHFTDFFFQNSCKFDVIFTSHIFEHLNTEERDSIINGIMNSLNQGGVWINVMPNAGSIIGGNYLMYCDYTHQRLYTPSSFEQCVNTHYSGSITFTHHSRITHINIFKKGINWMAITVMRKLYWLIGWEVPKIATLEFYTTIQKLS